MRFWRNYSYQETEELVRIHSYYSL